MSIISSLLYGWFGFCSFFFFKQKTAYEMRISDWSSDVCSSDLCPLECARSMAHDTREFNQWSFETKALWIGNITVIVLQCSILICPLVLLSTTRRGPNDGIPNLQIFLPCKRSVGGTDGAAGLGGG